MDYTDSRVRAGSSSLFAAIARSRPALHCFGHIHEGWGAKLVNWREELSEYPSHFTDIDNDQSKIIENLARITATSFDDATATAEKTKKREEYLGRGYCTAKLSGHRSNQTLFVNASIEALEEGTQQLPWIVDIELRAANGFPLARPTPLSGLGIAEY